MNAVPIPDAAEVTENAAFDALLWAMSRPGQIRTLPPTGEAAVVDALLDRECCAYATDPALCDAIDRTGAARVGMSDADHVFLGTLAHSDVLKDVATGTDLYPDAGATIVLHARFGVGARLRLAGPGVDGAQDVRIDGLPRGFWDQRRIVLRYPTGFDLFLVDGTSVMGIPRSTAVEAV